MLVEKLGVEPRSSGPHPDALPLHHFSTLNLLERPVGLEPTPSVWRTEMRPVTPQALDLVSYSVFKVFGCGPGSRTRFPGL